MKFPNDKKALEFYDWLEKETRAWVLNSESHVYMNHLRKKISEEIVEDFKKNGISDEKIRQQRLNSLSPSDSKEEEQSKKNKNLNGYQNKINRHAERKI